MKLSTTTAILGAALASMAAPQLAVAQSVDVPITPPSADATIQVPGVTLGDVTVLGPSTARVHASIDPNGLATSYHLEYGTNGLYNLRTPSVSVGAGLDPTKVVTDLLDLEPGQSYNYRIVATNLLGTTTTASGGSGGPGAPGGPGGSFTTAQALKVDPQTGKPTTAANAVSCSIVGTNAADTITGTAGSDVICVLGGSDRVSAGAGSDVVYGAAGADRLSGQAGNDRLYGNDGADRLNGGSGNDTLVGGKARDRIAGSSGKDRLTASDDRKGGDRLNGGRGRDRATANRRDRVRGVERLRRRR